MGGPAEPRVGLSLSLSPSRGDALTVHHGPQQQQQSGDEDGTGTRPHGCSGAQRCLCPAGGSVGSVGRTRLSRGWGWDSFLCPALGQRGGGEREEAVQGELGGFPQRGPSVFKYSAYKRGQEFPAQTAREGGNSPSQLPALAPAAGDFCAVVFKAKTWHMEAPGCSPTEPGTPARLPGECASGRWVPVGASGCQWALGASGHWVPAQRVPKAAEQS